MEKILIYSKDFDLKPDEDKEKICETYRKKRQNRKCEKLTRQDWLNLFQRDDFLTNRKNFSASIKRSLSTVRDPVVLKAYKDKLVLTPELREIFAGCMLGDFGMRKSGKNFSVKVSQGDKKHKAYVWHLYDKFYYYSLTVPQPYYRNRCLNWQWDMVTHPEFNSLHDEWYSPTVNSNGKIEFTKIVPTNFEKDYLSERTVAYWFMDDGYLLDPKGSGKAISFATHGFTKMEVERLCQSLRNKYGWQVWAKPNKKKYVVSISGKSFDEVKAKIEEFIRPSMMYKFPTPRVLKEE